MSYEKQEWETGEVITASKLNHIEDGVDGMNGSYEKQTWSTGEVITAEKLNHIEAGIENGFGITPTGTIAITDNGTYNVEQYASAEVDVSGNPPALVGAITIINNTSQMLTVTNAIKNIVRDGVTYVGFGTVGITKNSSAKVNVLQMFAPAGSHLRHFGNNCLIITAFASLNLSVTHDSAFTAANITKDAGMTGNRYMLDYVFYSTTDDITTGTITISES